jgi:hypothetical protein
MAAERLRGEPPAAAFGLNLQGRLVILSGAEASGYRLSMNTAPTNIRNW